MTLCLRSGSRYRSCSLMKSITLNMQSRVQEVLFPKDRQILLKSIPTPSEAVLKDTHNTKLTPLLLRHMKIVLYFKTELPKEGIFLFCFLISLYKYMADREKCRIFCFQKISLMDRCRENCFSFSFNIDESTVYNVKNYDSHHSIYNFTSSIKISSYFRSRLQAWNYCCFGTNNSEHLNLSVK